MLIFDHERERRILERRLELSEMLDSIVRRDIAFGTTTDPESPEVRHIAEQFDSVLHLATYAMPSRRFTKIDRIFSGLRNYERRTKWCAFLPSLALPIKVPRGNGLPTRAAASGAALVCLLVTLGR